MELTKEEQAYLKDLMEGKFQPQSAIAAVTVRKWRQGAGEITKAVAALRSLLEQVEEFKRGIERAKGKQEAHLELLLHLRRVETGTGIEPDHSDGVTLEELQRALGVDAIDMEDREGNVVQTTRPQGEGEEKEATDE